MVGWLQPWFGVPYPAVPARALRHGGTMDALDDDAMLLVLSQVTVMSQWQPVYTNADAALQDRDIHRVHRRPHRQTRAAAATASTSAAAGAGQSTDHLGGRGSAAILQSAIQSAVGRGALCGTSPGCHPRPGQLAAQPAPAPNPGPGPNPGSNPNPNPNPNPHRGQISRWSAAASVPCCGATRRSGCGSNPSRGCSSSSNARRRGATLAR